jgi:hypothetical protein
MMKQFDHMIERKLNLELSNVFPRLKFLTGCGQFSDFSNIFRILQHFPTKLCNVTNFNMLFLAVVMDFVLLA